MPYNTGNPIPSSDAKDLSDNAENLDNSVNTALDTWTDRLGVERRTIQGQLKLLGYTAPDVYAGGLVFTVADNMATIDRNGTIYAPKPSAIPFTTSGTWTADDENKFFVVQGLTLESSELLSRIEFTIDILLDTTSPQVFESDYYDTNKNDGSGKKWIATGTTGAAGTMDPENRTIYNGNGDGYKEDGEFASLLAWGADPTGVTPIDTIHDGLILSGAPIDYGQKATYKRSTGFNASTPQLHIGGGYERVKVIFEDGLTSAVTSPNVELHGINFSADGNSCDVTVLDVKAGAHGFIFDKCRVGDTFTTVQTANQTGLLIDANDVTGYIIRDSLFENISCMGDENGDPVGFGFASGFYLSGNGANEAAYTNPSTGDIYDCQFFDIWTEKNPLNAGLVDFDADAVRIRIPGGITPLTEKQWRLNINNCVFSGVQKSAVKCGGMTGLTIRNTTVISNRTDIPMITAHRIQWGAKVEISNTTCIGHFTYLMNLFGADISVDGVYYSPQISTDQIDSYCVLIQTESGFENRNITVSDVRATKALGLLSLTDPNSVGSTGRTMSFKDMQLERLLVSSESKPVIDVKNCTDVTLSGLKVYDSNDNADTCLSIKDYQGLTVENCHFEASKAAIKQSANSIEYVDLSIKSTVCGWSGSGNVTEPLVRLEPSSGTEQVLNGVDVEDLTIISRTTAARSENAMIVKAKNFDIKDIKVKAKTSSGNTSAPYLEAIEVIDSEFGSVAGVRYFTDTPTAGAGTSWAVNIENSDGITVSDVVSDNNGVVLRTGTTSTLVNGVNAGVGRTAIDDQAGGNTSVNTYSLVSNKV